MIDYAKIASLLEEIAKDLRKPLAHSWAPSAEYVYGAPLEALPAPVGFEKGEFRITKPGDWFLSRRSRKPTMAKATVADSVGIPRLILRPIAVCRKPSPEPEKAEEPKSPEPGQRAYDAWRLAYDTTSDLSDFRGGNFCDLSEGTRAAWAALEAYMPPWYNLSKKYVVFEVGEEGAPGFGDYYIDSFGKPARQCSQSPLYAEYTKLRIVHKPEEL